MLLKSICYSKVKAAAVHYMDAGFETTESWEDKCSAEFMKITHELQSSFLKAPFPTLPVLHPRYSKIP